ncbi:cyclin-dependent kinase G-2-like isoform X1 [Phalaenopsis equestris]|uniref:cyclin-dependent kinase G-2-like isoform X1 n=1 Tax=Phalaenopsis equestris TaxID=78828 RepID=UPI0009E49708|nr:cyclin-dependent kinase G-2-like isoform X1 [Phalaenopsis equestris]
MAAGRNGDYRDDELRGRESNLEITMKKDYYQERFREGDRERGLVKDRIRVRDKEVSNGSYRSPLSSNSSVVSKASNRLSRRSADREPGELSSGSGSDDADVLPYRGTVNGVEKPEEGDSSAAKKRKFSPIIWDRDDDKRSSAGSSRSRSNPVHRAPLPPPPSLRRGHTLSRPIEVVRQFPEQALPLDAEVSAISPQYHKDEVNGLGHGQVLDHEDDIAPARHISTSRWADTNNALEEDEAKAAVVEIVRKKKKSTLLAVSGQQYQLLKKLQSPELGEVRESSEGADSQSYSSSKGCSGDDEQNIGSGSNESMDIDEEVAKDDTSVHILDSDYENSSGEARTLEPMQPPQRSINMLQGCRSVDEFERLNKIDEGTYGVVYRAKDKITGDIVALKKVKMEKEREGFPLTSLREINILLSFHHPSIVDVKEVVVGSSLDSIFMVMEYMEHDLKGLMETMKQPFSQSEVKCLMLQLLSGVKYLHDNWVLHRDLKTSNLLLNNRGELKICDFGLARQYGSPLKPYTHLVVTLWYRAPELLLGTKQYSTAIDMWSLGCIMAEFLAKEPLFNGKTEFDQLDKIFRTLGTPNEKIWPGFAKLPGVKVNFVRQPYNRLREKFPPTSFSGRPTLSEAGFDLLNKLLTYDPEKRITAENALNHDWFREVPLPKEKDFMPTFPAQHAQDRRLRRIMKSPDPLEEQRRKELQLGDQVSTGLFG